MAQHSVRDKPLYVIPTLCHLMKVIKGINQTKVMFVLLQIVTADILILIVGKNEIRSFSITVG
jgi:hypothetical protein